MQLSREMIRYLAEHVVVRLEEKKMIEIDSSPNMVIDRIESAINHSLAIEDELENEVREILDSHGKMLDKEGVDYRKLFLMVKNKLARERDITL